MTASFLDQLEAVLDKPGLLRPGDGLERYESEWRGRYRSRALAVARPQDVSVLAAVVACCARHQIPVVAQGGNTGLVGGAVACGERRELLLSLDRMTAVRAVDAHSACMTVEAGCTLHNAARAAAEAGWRLPLALASGGSATIGGILATNAGGNETIRFGNARAMVLGVEAVLADGQVWHGLSPLRKDNAGYDLAQLLVGSEGTLAILSAATLALRPLPAQRAVAWLAVSSPAAALKVLGELRRVLDESLSAFELIPAQAIEFVQQLLPEATCPVASDSAWHVLVDCDCARPGESLRETLLMVLERLYADGAVNDAALAETEAQANAFWRLRESISDAQKTGGVSIKHDISLPVAEIPSFLDELLPMLQRQVPGIRPCVFGHLGDGNLHFNLSQPPDMAADGFLAREAELNELVFARVLARGGSIAAEHGIGLLRRDWLARSADPVALEAMRRIKQALDPNNLLNPGKVVG